MLRRKDGPNGPPFRMTGVVRIGVVRGGCTVGPAPDIGAGRAWSPHNVRGWMDGVADESTSADFHCRSPGVRRKSAPRADPPSAPTPPMGGLHQPPGQRVTRGDRSRGKSDNHPDHPPHRLCGSKVFRLPGSGAGTTGPSMPAGPIRTPPRYTKMRPGWAASSSKASFLLDRRSVKKTCRGQVFSAAPAELISAGGNHAGAENGVHSPGTSHPQEGPPPQGLTCGSSSPWPPRSTPAP